MDTQQGYHYIAPQWPFQFSAVRYQYNALLVPGEGIHRRRQSAGRIHCAFLDVEIEGILTLRSLDYPSQIKSDDFCLVCSVSFTEVQIIYVTLYGVDGIEGIIPSQY